MMFITRNVSHLLIINLLVFFGAPIVFGEHVYTLAVYYPESLLFRPWQVITYMFMHANFSHLFFNMFALYMFGPALETLWGPKRFLLYYFLCGFGALLLQVIVQFIQFHYLEVDPQMMNIPMVGASGAIFGLLAGYGRKFPNHIIQLLLPPIPLKAKYFVLLYAFLELALGIGNVQSNVAHFAHVGGALFGFLIMLYWERNSFDNRFR